MPKYGLDHLSYSSISLYLACGKAWKFRYVDKIKTPIAPTLVFGSAFHGAIETTIAEQSHDKIIEHWGKSWAKQIDENKDQIAWDVGPEEYYNDGVRMFTQLIDSIKTIRSKGGASGIERKVGLKIPGIPIPVIGYIDIIAEDGVPGDFKTSAKSWTDDQAQKEMQPLFYLAALSQLGETVPEGRFRHYVFVKTKTPKIQIIEHRHNLREMFFLFSIVQNVWKGIEAGVFVENPTTWRCTPRYCDYWSKCKGRWI